MGDRKREWDKSIKKTFSDPPPPPPGIPGSKGDFLRFVQGIRSSKEGMEAPMVIHCR